jgi:hypothetical protein
MIPRALQLTVLVMTDIGGAVPKNPLDCDKSSRRQTGQSAACFRASQKEDVSLTAYLAQRQLV